MYHLKLIAARD